MIKAVLFDLDETLISGLFLHIKAGKYVHEKYGINITKIPIEIRSHWHGMRIVDIEQQIIDFFELDLNAKDLQKERMEYFLKFVDEVKEKPNATKVIEKLKAEGYKIALATSGTKEFAEKVLKQFSWNFDAIVTGDIVSKGKPAPDTFLKACELLNVEPKDAVVIEDATHGVSSAKAAGCKCIAIPSANNLKQDLSKADLILNGLEEIGKKLNVL